MLFSGIVYKKSVTLLIAVCTLIGTITSCSMKSGDDESTPLAMLLMRKGIHFGAAVGPGYLDEVDYSGTLSEYFNTVTVENHMKWDLIHPAETTYDFTNADKIVDFAVRNRMAVRGHALLWYLQLPDWVTAKGSAELEGVLRDHITSIVAHYRGRVYSWDVVNEVMMNDGLGFRNTGRSVPDYSIWSNSDSDDYLIKKAFEFAHGADPGARLFLNDNNPYGSDGDASLNQAQADLLYNIIREWKQSGVPIHGVGFQLHLAEESPPDFSMIENDIIRYVNLGLEVQFTEIDIRIKDPVTEEKEQHQAEMYGRLMQFAMKYPKVSTYVVWGVTDKYSWVPTWFPGYGSALLFDSTYNPKPAYRTIADIMK